MGASDLVTVFNPHDGAMVRALGVETPVEVLAPLVEVDPIVVPAPGSGRVLFVGAMWRSENDEAARWLLDAVMPEVWTRAPDTRVRIAGARPSSSLLARTDGRLEITGYLDDLATAYQDVAVVAVPLRRGAGLKFKTVEAQAYGFPTVTTTVGAEGVADVVPGMVAAVVDDAASFADALVSALAGRAAGPDVARVRAALDFGASVARHARRCEALVAARRCGPEA
ncbi:MAG: hypothetical protein JWN84_4641 [Nocardioides sp.]|nr:hypothetical protein [Nocardioides sp.]